MEVEIPTVRLSSTSAKMPLMGMGLWKIRQEDCAEAVYQAIKTGYRLFDGASDYGNEKEAGEGVKRAIANGLVRREDLFIVSKLWNTYHAAQHVRPACQRSLTDWGLEYFDLYLIHFPIALKYVDPATQYPPGWTNSDGKVETERSPLQATWSSMEKLIQVGMVRNIGVCNFAGGLIMDLMTYAVIPPAVLQIEMNPFLKQTNITELCKEFGIHMMAFSSFGPQSWIELNDPRVKQVNSLFEEPVIRKAADAHSRSPAQVLLRWATQRGITVIPKSSNPARLTENLNSMDFDLDRDEVTAISNLDMAFRFNQPHGISARISIFA